jgi:uncharacterized protein YaaQ
MRVLRKVADLRSCGRSLALVDQPTEPIAVHDRAGALVEGLVAAGLLRRENAFVLVAAEERSFPHVLATIRRTCRRRVVTWLSPAMEGMFPRVGAPIEVESGGAVVCVLPVECVEHLARPDQSRPRAAPAGGGS